MTAGRGIRQRAVAGRGDGPPGTAPAGRLSGVRVAVLSDIHANLVALDAVLRDAGEVDAIWHLGDIVGYGPDPDGVVARLAAAGAIGVTGNHDRAAAGGSEIDWFNPDAKAAILGLTLGTRREQIVRAALESIAHQCSDLQAAFAADGLLKPESLRTN